MSEPSHEQLEQASALPERLSDLAATVHEAVYDAVRDSFALSMQSFTDAFYDCLGSLPVPLPPGSHLWLADKGKKGAPVVMLRAGRGVLGSKVEALTERGDWILIGSEFGGKVRLVVGERNGEGNE